MAEIATNRDLYRFIADLVKQHSGSRLSLEEYLENLRRVGHELRAREAIAPTGFAELLRAAFERAPDVVAPSGAATAGYLAWEQRIDAQLRDLAEMKRCGTLDNEYRYFGVTAPGGGMWFNFDPRTYLECATVGTFGGWEEGDDTGRAYVPGLVAALDASGAVTSVDPRDVDAPRGALPPITWETFIDFLDAGQTYE